MNRSATARQGVPAARARKRSLGATMALMMIPAFGVVAAGAVMLGGLAGCVDAAAQQRHEAVTEYTRIAGDAEKAMASSPVMVSADGEPVPQSQNPQIEQLQTLSSRLSQVVGNLPDELKDEGNSLLGTLYATRAEHAARLAEQNWADLNYDATALIAQFNDVFNADARAAIFNYDEAQLLALLREFQAREKPQLQRLRETRESLAKQQSELRREREAALAESAEAKMRSQELHARAMQETGQSRLEWATKSLEEQRKSQIAGAKADNFEVLINALEAKIALLDREIELKAEATAYIDEQIEATEERQNTVKSLREAALGTLAGTQPGESSKAAEEAELMRQYNDVAKRCNEDVAAVFDSAADLASKAVKAIETAENYSSRNRNRRDVAFNLLNARTMHVHVLTQHATVAGAYGQSLSLLARRADAVLPDRADFFKAQATALAQNQDGLIKAAKEIIPAAMDDTRTLVGGGTDDTVGLSAQQRQLVLTSYNDRLDKAALAVP